MQRYPHVAEAALDALPGPRVVADEGALVGEVEINPLLRPGPRQIGGAAHGRRAAADDNYRTGFGQPIVGGAKSLADVVVRLEMGLAPEPFGHSRRDDQRVIPLGRCRAVVVSDADGAGTKVDPGQAAVHGAHSVKAAEPVERDPVGSRPVVRTGQPPTQLLPTYQRRFSRDSNDLGVAGQSDRREHSAVAQPGDDDALALHPYSVEGEHSGDADTHTSLLLRHAPRRR